MGTISALEKTAADDKPTAIAGQGMDRIIAKKRFPPKKILTVSALVAVLVVIGYWFLTPAGRSLTIADNRLLVSPVESGIFEDTIPVRARVAPLKTVFLDAIQGGRVEEILIEDGTEVVVGQPIARLSNSDLQLSVMNTESRVMEQLNSMRDQELRLEQNRLSHKRTLVDVDYEIRRLTREIARQEELLNKGLSAQSNFDNLTDELAYNRSRRAVTLESQASDEQLMANQLAFFQDNTAVMEANLSFARESLEELEVKAPVTGKLSGFDLEVGQNVPRGTRIGQIDNANEFKLVANVDEFYLGRVDIDQQVNFEQDGREYQLRIAKIYPNVESGQFEIDMQFLQEPPQGLRRGQTIQAKLTLGDATEALLIPNGSFFQDTGGKWIFVVSPDGGTAIKRPVQLGRRNTNYIEVLDGLEAGEKVITSPYSGFRDMDLLLVNKSDDQ